jgi:hypothetical protein
MSVTDLLNRVGGSSLEQEELQHSWQDFVNLISLKPTVVYSTDFKMATIYNNDLVRTNLSGMNMLNLTKSIVRLVFRGYGDHLSPFVFENKMPESGLVHFEEDFRDFGRAIGFLDPRQVKPAERTFKEGNFFTYHGNGDGFLTSTEFYEHLNMLITGGSLVVGNIFDDMQAQGCLTQDKDIFGKQIAVEDCFVKLFKKNIKVYLSHIPWMAQYLSQLPDDQFMQAYHLLMSVGRLPTSQPNRVEWVEIRTLTTVLQYVESIYSVYDLDRDQMLSAKEVRGATPRFATFISSISPLKSHMVEDIFLYLVYEGKKPTGLTSLLSFKVKSMTGLPKADRMNLFKVIGVLKSEAE